VQSLHPLAALDGHNTTPATHMYVKAESHAIGYTSVNIEPGHLFIERVFRIDLSLQSLSDLATLPGDPRRDFNMSEEERKAFKKQEECLLKAATKDDDPIKYKHVRSMLCKASQELVDTNQSPPS
jgi:hypothetical protein